MIPARRLRMVASIALAAGLALPLTVARAQDRPAAPAAPSGPTIASGVTVRIEYTLKDAAGAVLDSTRDREPLRYVQGQAEILPGLERALEGLQAGAETRVILTPDEAYGFVDPEAQTEIPREMVPAAAAVVGTRLTARNQAGAARQVVVKEVREKTIILDMNHPLAGKTLVFEVKVLEVQGTAGTPAAPSTPAPAAPPGARPSR